MTGGDGGRFASARDSSRGQNALEMVVENLPGGVSPMGLCVQWKGVARRAAKREAEK